MPDLKPLHPAKRYFALLRASRMQKEYTEHMNTLAEKLGVSRGTLAQLGNPNQPRKLSVTKALALEIHTHGEIPAESVNDEIADVLRLANIVLGWREAKRANELAA